VVVAHLYDKDNGCTRGRNKVGNEEEYANLNSLLDAQHQSLTHKAETAHSHHDKSRKGYAVGITGANGLNCLWQITQNHSNTGYPSANLIKKSLLHKKEFSVLLLLFACKDTQKI
jgi:hypothetical protein